jgi:hypothetical protein
MEGHSPPSSKGLEKLYHLGFCLSSTSLQDKVVSYSAATFLRCLEEAIPGCSALGQTAPIFLVSDSSMKSTPLPLTFLFEFFKSLL